jgi:YVTN family beta-propeller protein
LPDSSRANVAAENADTVNVFYVSAQQVIVRIKAASRSNGVTVHPDGKRVYVTSGGEGMVQVIDTTTNSIIAKIPVGKLSKAGARDFVRYRRAPSQCLLA